MKVLVIGGGGREHALAWALSRSGRVRRVFCAPGNAGIAAVAECVPVAAEDGAGLLRFAAGNGVDLTVVGPEAPLVAGVADRFAAAGLAVLGPCGAGAAIEGSKAFAKRFMQRHGIPTARAEVFDDFAAARSHVRAARGPLVVKADGLAAGKGVVVADDAAAALEALEGMMVRGAYGGAGARVVVEERLDGEEASVMALTDGITVLPLPAAQDHKRVFDGDCGPNTGGMGAYAPVPLVDAHLFDWVREHVLQRTVDGLREEGVVYRGVLYAGLMIGCPAPGRHLPPVHVLEFNCRFGDPEAQAVVPLLGVDLVDIAEAVVTGTLSRLRDRPLARPGAACCVVAAAAGYPGPYRSGVPVELPEELTEAPGSDDACIFHAGTRFDGGRVVTAGGRVLGVTGIAADLAGAVRRAYEVMAGVRFDGMHYRRDIAARALHKRPDGR